MNSLNEIQKYWNNNTLNYNLEKYNWPAWVLSVIQEIQPAITDLETLHEVLTPTEIVNVAKHVQDACLRKDFMERFDSFVAEYIPRLIDNREYLIQRQGTLRVVIPDQAKVGRRLWFHQGIFVGNGRGCRTIWTPMTEARDTNTMWIMDLETSRAVTKQSLAEKWSLEKFEDFCIAHSKPVNLKPGQSHLFMQEHIHGNVNNEEGYTRISLDMRILIKGEEYLRRNPGGFMRLPGDHNVAVESDNTGRIFVTYAAWASTFSKYIPLPLQRGVIDRYCQRNKIQYNDYLTDNEFMDWQPALEHYIRLKPDGIVMHSMQSLTDDVSRRSELLHLALDHGVEIHFADESVVLKNADDLKMIETYLSFAPQKSSPFVWEE